MRILLSSGVKLTKPIPPPPPLVGLGVRGSCLDRDLDRLRRFRMEALRTGGRSSCGSCWREVVRRAEREGREVGEGEEVPEETERLRCWVGVAVREEGMGGGLRGEVWMEGP
jgi:hypothetical protein